ncbi:mechanosensitive ion channel family protein [Candidatus Saccharibacteria bacterium]|nr:mechanosensitive ion channel family protein [Candidatus Saccharibacteria bacterium]
MSNVGGLWDQIIENKLTASILVLVVVLIIYFLGYRLVLKKHLPKKTKNAVTRRGQTYWRMITSIFRYTLLVALLLGILKVNGVNVDSLLAGLGIAGVVAGLAIQDVLKDMIRGFSLVTDSYFSVGDVIKYKDDECKVISIGLRTTKLESTISGNIISISNRNIEQAEVVKDVIFLTLPTPYGLPLDKMEQLMNSIVDKVTNQEKIGTCDYLGIKKLGDNSIDHLFKVHCRADQRTSATRKSLKAALREYEKYGVEVPFAQLDVHLDKNGAK